MAMDKVKFARNRLKCDNGNICAVCSIREVSICANLDKSELSQMASIARNQSVLPQQTIIGEGEVAELLFNITSGAVKIYKLLPDGRRQITGFLFKGDFLGIAHSEEYAYSAEAVSNVTLCRLPRRRFKALLDEIPRLEKQLLEVVSNELTQAQDQMLLLGRKTAREKVVSFLLSLSDHARKGGQKVSLISLPMNRADIADYLGLTTETVSRTFTNLKSNGAIRLLPGNMVELAESDKLKDMADGS